MTLTYLNNFGERRKLHRAKDGLYSMYEGKDCGCYFVRGVAVILIMNDGQQLEVGELAQNSKQSLRP